MSYLITSERKETFSKHNKNIILPKLFYNFINKNLKFSNLNENRNIIGQTKKN